MKKKTYLEGFAERKLLMAALVTLDLPPEFICREMKINQRIFKEDLKQFGFDPADYPRDYSWDYCFQAYAQATTNPGSVTKNYQVDERLGRILFKYLDLQKIYDIFDVLEKLGSVLSNPKTSLREEGYASLLMEAHDLYCGSGVMDIWLKLLKSYAKAKLQDIPSKIDDLQEKFLKFWADYHRQNLGVIWTDDFNPREFMAPIFDKLFQKEEIRVIELYYGLGEKRGYSSEEIVKMSVLMTTFKVDEIIKNARYRLREYFKRNSALGIIKADTRVKKQ